MGVRFYDRLVNLVTGLGTAKEAAGASAFTLLTLSKAELDAAYRCDWLSRKIVSVPPDDMTREWRTWSADEEQITILEEAERALGVQEKVKTAMDRARLYGGAGLFLGIRGQDAAVPLDINTVGRGGLEYIHLFTRHDLKEGDGLGRQSAIVRDPLSPYFGQPEFYTINTDPTRRTATGTRIHASRFIRFIGADIPDPLSEGTCWGDPILQVIYEAVRNAASVQQHTAALIPEAKVDVISVPGLGESLSTDGGTLKITTRFQLAATLKSMHNMLLIEGGEEGSREQWEQKEINLSQYPEVLRTFLQIAAGAADIPAVRLLSQSPIGMNATGESDLRNHYDSIASMQENDLRPRLSRLDEALIRSALGTRPAEIWYEFDPLWQMSEKEKADVGKITAETVKIYSDTALVPTPVLEQAVKSRLVDDGTFPGIEKAYAEFEAATELDPALGYEAPEGEAGNDTLGGAGGNDTTQGAFA